MLYIYIYIIDVCHENPFDFRISRFLALKKKRFSDFQISNFWFLGRERGLMYYVSIFVIIFMNDGHPTFQYIIIRYFYNIFILRYHIDFFDVWHENPFDFHISQILGFSDFQNFWFLKKNKKIICRYFNYRFSDFFDFQCFFFLLLW